MMKVISTSIKSTKFYFSYEKPAFQSDILVHDLHSLHFLPPKMSFLLSFFNHNFKHVPLFCFMFKHYRQNNFENEPYFFDFFVLVLLVFSNYNAIVL